jgi:ribonuclease HII
MKFTHILGIDEVGRGCLAGPVTMTGVLLPARYPYFTQGFSKFTYPKEFTSLQKAKDSKRLFPHQRADLVKEILNHNDILYNTVSASSQLIDTYGIGVCLSHIVYILINHLSPNSATVEIIIDGKITLIQEPNIQLLSSILAENHIMLDTQIPLNQYQIIRENKADDRFLSVALASNIAKVARDEYMTQLSEKYPLFEWQKNKGYGTEKHRQVIKKNIVNPYLRQSFLSNIKSSMV